MLPSGPRAALLAHSFRCYSRTTQWKLAVEPRVTRALARYALAA